MKRLIAAGRFPADLYVTGASIDPPEAYVPLEEPRVQCVQCLDVVDEDVAEECDWGLWCHRCLEAHVACCTCGEPVPLLDAAVYEDDFWCTTCLAKESA